MSVVVTKESIPGIMHNRGGFPAKTVIYALFILSLVYLFYIYTSSQNRLREAEMTGARYKREAEERVTEIQELVRAKDRSQEGCQNEKSELHNRIKSLNQQYSMVQSQYKETEADFIKLRQDVDTMKLEHAQADSAHAAEYEKLKQEKENDIAKLKDDVADLTRQNQNLESTVTSLQQKVRENEVTNQDIQEQYKNLAQNHSSLQNAYRQLLEQNSQLQQKLQNPSLNIAQPKLPNEAQPRDSHLSPGQDQAEHQVLAGDNKILQPNQDLFFGDANKQAQGQSSLHTEAAPEGHLRPAVDDSLNAQHQMRPPNNINVDNDESKKGYKDVSLHHDVNPNDEQKAQILGPALDANDKHQGGGEVDVVGMNIKRGDEDNRDKIERDDDAGNVHHNNPLALGQIAMPRGEKEIQDAAGRNKKDDQHLPLLVNDENDQKEQDRGENHYFGEDEEAQQQQEEEQQRHQQQEDERQRMEEDEGDEGDHRFRDDIGNEDNKEAALAAANN